MNQFPFDTKELKAIVGLGNPGPRFYFTPHNIGFLAVDKLCEQYQGLWQEKKDMLISTIFIDSQKILLIKPQTFMNNSGKIFDYLLKLGIKAENLLVVHDEIDFPFGKINFKMGGSARGHNGLRSLIAHGSDQFLRLRIGVGRPALPEQVKDFVTAPFQETRQEVEVLVTSSVSKIIDLFVGHLNDQK
ncbi:aminoacyl-tRNA hydrolase [Candidatus Dependentiae bacterium]|nr:aminoacyl-tRNA hydrolase [Candidatus Dependentiae bacterium]